VNVFTSRDVSKICVVCVGSVRIPSLSSDFVFDSVLNSDVVGEGIELAALVSMELEPTLLTVVDTVTECVGDAELSDCVSKGDLRPVDEVVSLIKKGGSDEVKIDVL
jgi:hypothetical protein